MHVERRDARQRQEVRSKEPAVPHRQDEVGRQSAHRPDDLGQVRGGRREAWNPVGARDVGNRLEPAPFMDIGGVGDHGRDVLAAG